MEAGNQHNYTIGIVARRTNIHPETLRIWERRYNLVVPGRNDTGRRLYSESDVLKLSLVKQLTELGHPVGGLAELSIDSLRSRLAQATADVQPKKIARSARCGVIFVGESLTLRMQRELPLLEGIELVACLRPSDDHLATLSKLGAEILIAECTTVNEQSLTLIRRQLSQSRCTAAIVIYSFGTKMALADLERAGVICLKGAITTAELSRACLSLRPASPKPALPVQAEPTPPRFDAKQLARIAALSPAIRCECPNHLAELVTSLTAFEQYSSECANSSREDAALHQHLHRSTASARAILEECLSYVIKLSLIHI